MAHPHRARDRAKRQGEAIASIAASPSYLRIKATLKGIRRRRLWMQERLSLSQLSNLARNVLAFATHAERAAPLPSVIKIDISPQCSLACTHCLHAVPEGRDKPLLAAQRFAKTDRMSLAQYGRIIDQLRGRAVAVSLYYYGDPLIHPDLDAMIRMARAAGLAVHITTHFSYKLSLARIRSLVESGLSHITVAVDGATQESYSATRVRGRLDFVLANLAMVAQVKRETGRAHPFVEVQHLRFPHHAPDERERVQQIARDLGADKFTTYSGLHKNPDGSFYNVVDDDPGDAPLPPARPLRPVPRCLWPYSSTVIRFDGTVIPCCLWRVGRQYAEGEDPRGVGNIFETPLSAIWNSRPYRQLRRQVSNPRRFSKKEGCGSFCDGCPRLYEAPGADQPAGG